MIRVILTTFLCILFLNISGLAVQLDNDNMYSPDSKNNKELMLDEIRQEQLQFQEDLVKLIEKYNMTPDKKKDTVVKEIRKIVSVQTSKEIAHKRVLLKMQRARIDELEKRFDEIEKKLDNYVIEKVEFFISPQGQLQIQKSKNSTTIMRTISFQIQG